MFAIGVRMSHVSHRMWPDCVRVDEVTKLASYHRKPHTQYSIERMPNQYRLIFVLLLHLHLVLKIPVAL